MLLPYVFLLALCQSAAGPGPADPEEAFIAEVKQNTDQLNGRFILGTRAGMEMIGHVATMLTDFDLATAKNAGEWMYNFAKENKATTVAFCVCVAGGTKEFGPLVQKHFTESFEYLAEYPPLVRLVAYQILMFVRAFVAGILPGGSPIFTVPIQMTEAAAGGPDHTMAITCATAVLPNLMAMIPGFSEFMWRKLRGPLPIGAAVGKVMQDSFESGVDPKEKAGNAIALGHFTPGSGTFTTLVAGMFSLNAWDLILSGELGISDDLIINVGMKASKEPLQALSDANFLISGAQLFQIFHKLLTGDRDSAIMHVANFIIIQLMTCGFQHQDVPALQKIFPMVLMISSMVILPGIERLVLRHFGREPLRAHASHQPAAARGDYLVVNNEA